MKPEWTLFLRGSERTHASERAKARERMRSNAQTNASAPARSQAAQIKHSRTRAAPSHRRFTQQTSTGTNVCGDNLRQPSLGPTHATSQQPNQAVAGPRRDETTANKSLHSGPLYMLPGTKTSARRMRRGKTGTGAPKDKKNTAAMVMAMHACLDPPRRRAGPLPPRSEPTPPPCSPNSPVKLLRAAVHLSYKCREVPTVAASLRPEYTTVFEADAGRRNSDEGK